MPHGVAGVVFFDERGVRFGRALGADKRVRTGLHAGVRATGRRRQHCAAIAGALLGLGQRQRDAQHIGQNFPPQRAFCTAAAQGTGCNLHALCAGNFYAVTDGESHALQYRLRQRGARGVHPQPDKCAARGGVVVGAALAHQVRQKVDIIRPQLVWRDGRLLGSVIGGVQHFLAPPLVAAGGGQDAAHQVVAAIRMGEAVQGVLLVYAKGIARDKYRARCAQGYIAFAAAHGPAADSRRCVIARACADDHVRRQAQLGSSFGGQRTHWLPALKQLRQLGFVYAADLQHFPAPTFVFNVQQQHARSIGIIGAVYTGQLVVDVILRQHDLFDAGEVVRLVFPHPKQLWCGEACKGNVSGAPAQLLFADDLI